MNDFNIQVKVDPGSSTASIKQVETALAQTEIKMTATERAAVAVGKAFTSLGARASQEMAQGMSSGMRAFDGMTAAIKREADVLAKIRAPQMEYFDNLMALDKLLERNAISTHEYAEQVSQLNRQIESTPKRESGGGEHGGGAASEILGGLGGPAGGILAGIAGGGLIGGAIEGIKGIGEAFSEISAKALEHREHVRELRDAYVELTNAAGKFVDGGHDVSQIIDEQTALSHDLHTKLHETIDLYDQVRDGTDGLNLTHAEQIRVTRTLGEAFQLSNKSLGDAAGLMQKLSYAAASNTMTTGELTTIMRQVPALADLWTEKFHTSRAGLTKMLEDGKVDARDLALALADGPGKVDEAWKRNKRTIAEWREELKTAFEVAKQQGNGSLDAMQIALEKTADASIDMETRIESAAALGNQLERGFFALSATTLDVEGAMKRQADAGQTVHDILSRIIDDTNKLSAKHEADVTAKGFRAISQAVRDAGKELAAYEEEEKRIAAIGAGLEAGTDPVARQALLMRGSIDTIREAREQLAALNAVAGSLPLASYRSQFQALQTTINGGKEPAWLKVLDQIRTPMETYKDDLGGLNSLLADGTIKTDQYEASVRQLATTLGAGDFRKALDALGGPTAAEKAQKQNSSDIAQGKAQSDYVNAIEERGDPSDRYGNAAAKYRKEVGQATGYVMDGGISQDQYNLRIKQVTEDYEKAIGATDAYKDRQKDLQTLLDQMNAPLTNYRKGLDLVSQLQKDGAISATRAKEQIEQLKKTFDEQDPTAKQAKKDQEEMRKIVETGIKPIEDELIKLAQTGKASWHDMVESMLHDLEALAINKAFTGLVNGLFPTEGSGPSAAQLDAGVVTDGISSVFHGGGGSSGTSERTAPGGGTQIIVQGSAGDLLPAMHTPDVQRTVIQLADKRARAQARLRTRT